ncbi:MAG: TMEM43 family protein [Pseudomonadota bacterium]
MSDSITEVTRKSWFSRLKDSVMGTLFGLLLFLAAFVVLFWNEGRAVKTHKSLQEGAGIVVSVTNGSVDSANEGNLIHVSGKAETSAELTDPLFDVTITGVRLTRKVEMLQWKENSQSKTEKNLGGSTETTTTYSYEKVWSEKLIDSSGFKKPRKENNPASMPFSSESWEAENVSLGAFKLSKGQISGLSGSEAVELTKKNKIDKDIAGKARPENGLMYLGSKKHNKIGDIRVTMLATYPGDVSIVAKQSGDSFSAYQTEVGGTIQMLSQSIKPASEMFDAAEAANTTMTWILRFVGLMMMFIGLTMIVKILSVIGDLIPFVGSIIGALTGFVAFLIALVLSLITIAIAWIFYRPLIAGILIVVAIGLLVLAKMRAKPAEDQAEAVPEG